jgi:hypothetical protein
LRKRCSTDGTQGDDAGDCDWRQAMTEVPEVPVAAPAAANLFFDE